MAYKRISPSPVIEGNTGVASNTVYAPLCGGTTSTGAIQSAGTDMSNSGYALTSNGGALPTWQAVPAGSNDFVLLETVNASAAATVTLSSGIASTYDNYVIKATWTRSTTSNMILQLVDSGGTITTGYTGTKLYVAPPSSGPTWGTDGSITTNIWQEALGSGQQGNATIFLYNCTSNTRNVVEQSYVPTYIPSATPQLNFNIAQYGTVTVVTSFLFTALTGNITGRFSLYGVVF